MTTYRADPVAIRGAHYRNLQATVAFLSPGPGTTYHMRGWDQGSEQFVYWSSGNPNATPAATTPQATGTIVRIIQLGRSVS
jgi:hypothetical protein